MSNDELSNWASQITQGAFEFWQTDFPDWKHGIKLFFTPLRMNPELLIVTLNPGGTLRNYEAEDKVRFERDQNFFPPPNNEYSTLNIKWPMSMKLRNFFQNNMTMLEGCVGIPIIFFRSPDFSEIGALSPEKKKKMFDYCFSRTRIIIQKINPSRILVIGLSTYSYLEKALGPFDKHLDIQGKTSRIGIVSAFNQIPIFAVRHLTGSRISKSDLEVAKLHFFGD